MSDSVSSINTTVDPQTSVDGNAEDNTKIKNSDENNIISRYNKNNNIYIDYMRFTLGFIIICCLLYYMYNSFYNNQLEEPFIEKTIKSDIISDKSSDLDTFNVMDEICILKKKQEEYLNRLKY